MLDPCDATNRGNRTGEIGACSVNVRGAFSVDRLLDNLLEKLTDSHWLLIGGIAIAAIAIVIAFFPQRPK